MIAIGCWNQLFKMGYSFYDEDFTQNVRHFCDSNLPKWFDWRSFRLCFSTTLLIFLFLSSKLTQTVIQCQNVEKVTLESLRSISQKITNLPCFWEWELNVYVYSTESVSWPQYVDSNAIFSRHNKNKFQSLSDFLDIF